MKILVPVKSVMDVELNIRVRDGQVVEEGMNYILSKWDENAIEAALQLKEAGEGSITVASVGPARAAEVLRKALAMGADDAVHIADAAAEGSDAFAIGRLLAAVAQRDYDLIVTGRQAQDTDLGAVPAVLGVLLDWPVVANVVQIEAVEAGALTVHRQGAQGREVISLKLPAVLTASDALNEPRLASLRGIMQAKKKPFETLTLADLGVDASQVGTAAARTVLVEVLPPQGRGAGQKFEGSPAEVVPQVVALLANEAKIFS